MFSFLKKKGGDIDIPEWANFFTGKDYSIFIVEIEKYFNSLSVSYEIYDGIVQVKEWELGLNQLGLVNVAQVCKQGETIEYGEIIKEHFDALIRTNEFNAFFETIVTDFDSVKKYLGVRVYNDDYFKQVGIENTIGIYLAKDIYSTLIFDLPDSINNVKPEEAEKWSQNNAELIKIGIENIKQKYEWKITEEKLGKFNIWFAQSDHFFAPNIVFDLQNRKELLSDKGILIAMPHRHAVLIYPIKTLEVVQAINTLIPIVYGMNQEGPGSLTNRLYYYNDGIFIDLPYQLLNGKLDFTPPEEFINVLNNLK